jgi:hypothetical protein
VHIEDDDALLIADQLSCRGRSGERAQSSDDHAGADSRHASQELSSRENMLG